MPSSRCNNTMKTMEKTLIIGPSWVGDMVMSQSLYKRLKEQSPDMQIDVMAPAWCKPILERMPEVRQAIEMPLGHGETNLLKRRALGKAMRGHYDRAYILPNSAKSALIPWFANIPVRVGWKGEMRYGLLNDLRANKESFQFMVERYVALAHPKETMQDSSSLGGLLTLPKPQLSIDAATQQATLDKFALTTNSGLIIGLCPGAEFGPAKQWPVEHYAQVAEFVVKKGQQIWLFGSGKDRDTCENIKQSIPTQYHAQVHNLAGKTSLIEAVDLLAACDSVISNDSGLMHVAAAVGCHVIGVYGSTSPDYTPPLADKVNIVHTDIACRPCFQRECPLGHLKCLTSLQPSKVIAHLPKMDNTIL